MGNTCFGGRSKNKDLHDDGNTSNTARGLPPTELEMLKMKELAQVLEADRVKRKDGDPWYVVEAAWVHRWLKFVQGGDRVKNPGPINNRNLLLEQKENKTWTPKPLLRAARKEHMGHYRRVNQKVWDLWTKNYGGSGPAIWVKTAPYEDTTTWEIDLPFLGVSRGRAVAGGPPAGNGSTNSGGSGSNVVPAAVGKDPNRLWPSSSQTLGIGEIEDGALAKDTKNNATAYFDAALETPESKGKREEEDKKIRKVGAVGVKSAADEQREALKEALLPAGRDAAKDDLTKAEEGVGSPLEPARKSSAVIDAWMFGDGTE